MNQENNTHWNKENNTHLSLTANEIGKMVNPRRGQQCNLGKKKKEVKGKRSKDWMEVEAMRAGEYELKSKVGEGSFSTVWKAEHIVNGQQVAMKQVYLSKLNRHLRNCLECGLTFLSSVNHPNIVRLFNVFSVCIDLIFVAKWNSLRGIMGFHMGLLCFSLW